MKISYGKPYKEAVSNIILHMEIKSRIVILREFQLLTGMR